VNPHFLFNTLNTIIDLIGSNPEKAEIMTERLAEVFRYVLARTDRNLIAVSEEFEFLHTYLEIERARFGDRLRVEMAVDPSVAAEPIPSLILQPLVENAIKHGLAPKLGGGNLRIRAVDEGEFVRFVVEDDGVGWAENKKAEGGKQKADEESVNLLLGVVGQNHLNSTSNRSPSYGGVGLRNVTERLRTLYGDRAEVNIRSEAGQGTCVSILIPRNETQNLDHRRRSVGAISIAEVAERSS
jgi:two-component system LytT family sensor kinase